MLRNAKRMTRSSQGKVAISSMGQLLKQTMALQAGLRQKATVRTAPKAKAQAAPRAPRNSHANPQVHHGSHAAPTGARDYRLFLPLAVAGNAAKQPMPLVVMLHGCTQTPDDFAAGTRMDEFAQAQGFAVLYPAQSRRANPQGCWQWFKHSHQQRSRGEPSILAGMVAEVVAKQGLDASRVYVAGLSAGGAMAAILGQTHPEVFAAVGVHSGLPAGSAHDLPTAMAAMQSGAHTSAADSAAPPTIVFHGDADATVHQRNGQLLTPRHLAADSTAVPPAQTSGRPATRSLYRDAQGQVVVEHWQVHGAGHAWSGGSAQGSYTDPKGPDASAEMLRFFFSQ